VESVIWPIIFNKHPSSFTGFNDEKSAKNIAERAGLVLRYGFTWVDGVLERPVNEQEFSIRYWEGLKEKQILGP
jgi:hypothetical protein